MLHKIAHFIFMPGSNKKFSLSQVSLGDTMHCEDAQSKGVKAINQNWVTRYSFNSTSLGLTTESHPQTKLE